MKALPLEMIAITVEKVDPKRSCRVNKMGLKCLKLFKVAAICIESDRLETSTRGLYHAGIRCYGGENTRIVFELSDDGEHGHV